MYTRPFLFDILSLEHLIFYYFFCEQKKPTVQSKLETFKKRKTSLISQHERRPIILELK